MLTLRALPPRRLFARGRPSATDLSALYFDSLWRHWSPGHRAIGLGLSAAATARLLGAPRSDWWRGWDAAEQALLAGARDADAHLAMAARKGLHRLINPGAYPLSANPLKNKRLFAERCRAAGLPAPETFLGDDGALGSWIASQTAVIVKPNYASKGVGVVAYQRAGDGWRSGGRALSHGEALAALAAAWRAGAVAQAACAPHPRLAHLSPGALPTLRVMTAVNECGAVEACDRVLRLSAGGPRPVDNFNAGNIVASVTADGRIGRGFRRAGAEVVELARHPASGEALAGQPIPDLDAAVALAIRAHEAFRDGFVVVGWDVGLADGGPTLIEGNWNPGADILQLVSGRGLGDSRLGELYAWRLRRLPAETWARAAPIERDRR
ncbi:sugar-transfer associated ATP-grasp domain-containing protein [Methylopila turkensis]|uniref:Alpha-L-glutamate ligase-related protein ATP-grasp domain-containing protein n=1 Tax=Methylopila turkensis TaxID=1437816 RepID=A0A9W6JS81_9HYPH|nr:sugar-transfer associated ATP-grasp domain-containing protein [Methylopila turkensis]GLK81344.1 hypothetical protein GCM10008174_30850 [Methylopila turkensis]